MATVTIVDETTTGRKNNWTLEFLDETLTLREFIRRRVYEEVKEFNARQVEHFRGLVQPTDAEQTLNGYRLKPGRKLDWEAQCAKALEAFERLGFVVLVDDRQVDDLDARIELKTGTEVTFLKLVPLVGG
ncbi:MAG: hypothetical protein SFU83_09770 [Meiothermus sp.]|nr:hypothetical protein [Meiothermus sp.]